MVATFAGLAIPGLIAWGSAGFVWGRIAGAFAMLAVRRHFVRRLLPHVELLTLGLRGLVPVAAAAGLTLGVRALAWGGERSALQAVGEIVLFVAGCALATWLVERPLLREVASEARSPRLTAETAGVPAV
jgi:thiol:disulfide interchange protein